MIDTVYASAVDKNRGELARIIGELLAARGMSQVELARASGVSESHVSRILKGEHLPTVEKLAPIAAALSVPEEILHRAYALSVGLRLEGVEITGEGLSAAMAEWPDTTPEVREAAVAAALAVIRALSSDGELPE